MEGIVMRKVRVRTRAVVATAAAVALVALGGAAWATTAIGDDVIQGCYDSGGNLKVVDTLPCPKGWKPLSWNKQGPQGEPGTFSGHFASSNGKFAIDVTDDGITLKGPASSIVIGATETSVFGNVTFYGTETHHGEEDHRGLERHFDELWYFGPEQHFGRTDYRDQVRFDANFCGVGAFISPLQLASGASTTNTLACYTQ